MQCLDDLTVVAMVEGRLDPGIVDGVEAHIDECPACRRLLAAVVRSDEAVPQAGVRQLAPGEACGRYLVLDRVGAGGMGVVYAAWDRGLDRKVALKLVTERSADDPKAHARLVREAKAMAAISHRNVVTVYDAGSLGDQVYVAMEYVAGGTLRAWLDAEQRPWRAVLERFIDAGRGLAAAHRAGLVHRDFKPDNVLVVDDERVVVTDFGLAAHTMITDAERGTTTSGSHTAAAGTPAYMAPEQSSGVGVSDRADQFSFCTALWEGLFGQRPFSGATVEQVLAATMEGVFTEPRDDRDVPRAVRRVLERGLHPDPNARHPNMDALLAALVRAARPRRRVLAVVVACGAIGAAMLIASIVTRDPCAGARERWAEGWGAEQRKAVASAFTQTGASYASATHERFERTMDQYADAWAEAWATACRDRASVRLACLEGHRARAFALVDALARSDRKRLDLAVKEALLLPQADECEQARDDGDAGELEAELAIIANLHRLGDPEARVRLDAVSARAESRPDLRAAVVTLRGTIALWDQGSDARALLDEAGLLALAADRPDVAAEAWLRLADLDAREHRFDWADHHFALAEAAADRLGADTRIHAKVRAARAWAMQIRGHFDAAREGLRQAVDAHVQLYGADHPATLAVEAKLADVLIDTRGQEEAQAILDRVLAKQVELFGDVSPDVVSTLAKVGALHDERGRARDAIATYERLIAIERELYGDESRPVLLATMQMGASYFMLDPAHGVALIESSLAKLSSADRSSQAGFQGRMALAMGHRIVGEHARAVDVLRPLLEELIRADDDVLAKSARVELAMNLRALGQLREARALLREVIAWSTEHYGSDDPWTVQAVVEDAFISVLEGKPDPAPFERALELEDREPLGVVGVRARLYLARALVALDRDRPRALALAREAEAMAHRHDASLPREIAAFIASLGP